MRRGKADEARKQMAKAKQVLDRGRIPEQEQFFPYLEGYVAFYSHDSRAAADALHRASVNDPFIACLLAQTYEALGDRVQAIEFYRRAGASRAHSVPAAYAQPFAMKTLALWNGRQRSVVEGSQIPKSTHVL